jgi:hypothetical protein
MSGQTMKPVLKPSLWWLLPAPVVFLAGVGGGLAWLLSSMANLPTEAIPFQVPGARTFQIEYPGTYILWNETGQARLSDGLLRNSPPLAETLAIVLRERQSLREIPKQHAYGIRRMADTRSRVAVAKWSIEAAGDYELMVSGGNGERTMAFGPSNMGSLTLVAVGAAALNLAGWAGAFAIVVAVFVRRTRFRRMLPRNDETPVPEQSV